jgi:hypothetical protein
MEDELVFLHFLGTATRMRGGEFPLLGPAKQIVHVHQQPHAPLAVYLPSMKACPPIPQINSIAFLNKYHHRSGASQGRIFVTALEDALSPAH